MNSFSHYTQNNNCNLILKKSLIFALYNKNLKNKSLYFKNNNSIKGFSKDPILNDLVYFASNGIKKNSIFRKNELNINKTNNNFISFFYNIENNLSIFNLYPQKYFSQLMINIDKYQKILYNWKEKYNNNNTIDTYFLTNYKLLNNSDNNLLSLKNNKQIFIKNYYNKYYFINNSGFIKALDNKLFQKNLLSGLLYVLPIKMQRNLKQLFALNYLLLTFLNKVNIFVLNNNIFKTNVILYTLYLKYINYSVGNYFSLNKIKIRKSNWLLYKYIKIYFNPTNKLINFLYNTLLKRITKFNYFLELNQHLYVERFFNVKKDINIFFKTNFLSINNKIQMIKSLFNYIYFNYSSNFNFLKSHTNLLFKYMGYKLLLLENFKKDFSLNFINYTNYLKLLNNQILNLNSNKYINDTYTLRNNIINWNIDFNIIYIHLNREFLNFKKTKNYIIFNKNLLKNRYTLAYSYQEINDLKKNINKFKRLFSKKKRNLKKNTKNNNFLLSKSKQIKLKNIKSPLFKYYNIINLKKINTIKPYVYK